METEKSTPNFTTDRPVAVLMVFLAAVVFGYFSLGQLPVTLMPEMSYPTLTVRTVYPGAAPEEVENDISQPIEEQLGVVSGLNEIRSISRAGVSDVVMEFVWGTSMIKAIQNTLEKLDTVYLPRGAEKPLLLHYDPSLDPVMELSLSVAKPRQGAESASEKHVQEGLDNAGARRLRRIAELQVKRALEPITGVAAARVRGGLEEEIHVLIDRDELDRVNISIRQVINRLQAENINAAGGRIREGEAEYMIRTINEYETLEEIANTIVFRQDGREIRLKDLGTVVHGQRDREMLTRTNGGESVQIDVYKEADSNMVKVGERIKTAVGSVDGSPRTTIAGKLYREANVVLEVVANRSVFIDNSINEVKRTAAAGGFLAIMVLLLFLRDIRTTAIIAVSIPISIFVTFAPLKLLGVSLNIMSLGGLAMGIGMLVDSSIVVLESIFRCREEGDSMRGAAIRGTKEVRGAVVASTLTSICVFFPMVFVEGLAGQVFGDLGLTVVTSLIASLIVAVLFIPMLASRTGFRLRGGAGMVDHPLGAFAGRITIGTLLLRVILPMICLLAVMETLWLGYTYWMESISRNTDPDKEVSYAAKAVGVVRFWGQFCLIPFVVSLAKVRINPVEAKGQRLSALWSSFDAFGQSVKDGGRFWWLKLPYFAFRLLLSFFLELVGLSLVWLIRLAAGLFFLFMRLIRGLSRWFERKAPLEERDAEHGWYSRVLRWALAHPVIMVCIAAGTVAATYVIGTQLETELLPEVHQSEFTFEVALPVGTPLDETVSMLSEVEEKILAQKEALQIETLLVMYGFDASNTRRSDEGEHSAQFKVMLQPSGDPKASEERVIAALREMFEWVTDINTRVARPVLFSSKKAVVIQINGEDLPELKRFSDTATELLSKSPELADVEPSLRSGAPEVQISYDRQQIIRHGLNINSVASQVRDMVKGTEATRLNRRDRRVPIIVRLVETDREQVADVGKLTINPGAETPIPLKAIAQMSVGEGPSEIRRIDGNRVALVEANIGGGSLGAAVAAAQGILQENIEWPDYMDFLITGQNKEWERSRSSLYLALGLSLFLVYVIMASQFESLVQPFIIMFTIPMAFVGTVLGLQWLGMNLSVVVFLGLIMLAGIVVNNAIVLVDYTNTLRGRGLALKDAIVQAGRVRVRPILMTTATTVLGLLPMALGLGEGAEIRTPMAVAVIFGLLTSTFLTLLIIPTIYYLFGWVGERYLQPVADQV
ncbi:MAG: Multidrug resistance protein MdtB [Verrucomicrobia subdivision 3 bacterium]|nr:Multidrug resistance protein MdtB [Limisphaerales bacterium]MCS1414909.1 Multidrug resistance protein MdtB [Limisphaerales bacterium]